MPAINKVTVLGTGVLGSQIAFQAAYFGYDVTAYDISDEIVEKAKDRFAGLAKVYQTDDTVAATPEKVAAALAHLALTPDLADAVVDADLVIEAAPESLDIKRDLYTKLADVAPAKSIFATNSSTLLPSDLKEFTGRPDRFLALHYANQVWRYNTAEIMGTTDTDPDVYAAVVKFAEGSGLVPIELKKEKAGYVLNSLLVPFLQAGAGLVLGGYADPETVDKTWRIATGAPAGPFEIYDVVGLTTAYNISAASSDPASQQWATYLKENYIDKGKLGVATGEGFYKY
ncbi:3-hydroxyacyl-CoA dehydrogenase [Marisediminicola antarctica]|uniref:3-hydroxybutyryl-CoA dehydrogenase n=1 Tax=Marisediminicola antarctica TaxID=674079 RepID=A0A7L5AHS7_9MICO|nr:3-hydroxyacyl-CoA dehydrogenase [Marisediminicola antarctica]QHO69867.1 3-hydroxybutyryl-CoA dehydrogenase [Marisediminicola antarctica]